MPWFSKDQLISRVAGSAGATLVKVSDIVQLPGATSVQEALEQLASYAASPIVPIPGGTPYFIANVSVDTPVQKSVDLRGYQGIGLDAKGVFVELFITAESAQRLIYFDSADITPGSGSSRLYSDTVSQSALLAPIPLGEIGANAGKIAYNANNSCSGLYAWAVGYWR